MPTAITAIPAITIHIQGAPSFSFTGVLVSVSPAVVLVVPEVEVATVEVSLADGWVSTVEAAVVVVVTVEEASVLVVGFLAVELVEGVSVLYIRGVAFFQ